MSSTLGGRAPRTDAELVRDMVRRVEALEARSTARIGPWVLSASQAGDLLATAPGGRLVTLSDPPQLPAVLPGVATPQSLQDMLADIVSAITNGVGDTLAHLVQWGQDLLNNAGKVVGNIWHVIVDGAHTVGDFFTRTIDGLTGKVWSTATGVLGNLWDAAQTLFHKNEKAYTYALAPRVFGAWQADLTDDVSFGMSFIDGKAKPNPGQPVLIPLTAHKDRTDIDSVKIGLYGIPGRCFMALYRVRRVDATEPDAYGRLAKAGDATLLLDLGDVTELLRATMSELKIVKFADTTTAAGTANPASISVTGGDLFYLQVVQTGVTQDMASWSAVTNLTTGLQPKALRLARTTTFTGGPASASFTDADVVTAGAGTAQYWGAMGKAIAQLDTGRDPRVTYIDGFNRDPGATPAEGAAAVGPDWVIRKQGEGDPKRWTPRIVRKLNAADGDYALSTEDRWLAHVGRLGTINQEVKFSLWWNQGVNLGDRAEGFAYLHGDGSWRWVYCGVLYDPDNKRWATQIFSLDNSVVVERGLDNSGTKAGAYYLPFTQYPNIQDEFIFTVENENSYSVRFRQGVDGPWQVASRWVDVNDVFKVTDANTEFGFRTPLVWINQGTPQIQLVPKSVIDNIVARDL